MANEHFYPPIEPYASGTLAVDEPHELYWEQCGNPEGDPILFNPYGVMIVNPKRHPHVKLKGLNAMASTSRSAEALSLGLMVTS